MKKTALILAGLCAFGVIAWEAQAINTEKNPLYDVELSLPHGFDDIELYGSLMFNIGPNAIEAGANDNDVYIGFNQRFGNVNISIYNSMGILVYSTVVNTDVQSVVIIPFSGVASGTYTVELNNANGSADGDFERD